MEDDSRKRLAEIAQQHRDAHLEKILEEGRLKEIEAKRIKEEKKAKIDREVTEYFDKFIEKHGQLRSLPFDGLKTLRSKLLAIGITNDYKVIFGVLEDRLNLIEKYMKKDISLRAGFLEQDLESCREDDDFFTRDDRKKVYELEQALQNVFSLILEELLYNFLEKYVASENKGELTEELQDILQSIAPLWLKQLLLRTPRISACASIPYIKEMIKLKE